jgi:two-component system copper resistance phosphate regulon response regulator CusR
MGIRILLVEDEDEIGDFVTRGLREEGFTVEWAADGDGGRTWPSAAGPASRAW